MADYKVESITEARIGDEPSSVRVAFAAGAEQVALTIDWRLASELIDRLAVVNNEIRHALSAPDTRALRIKTGFHRTGIGLAILLLLPVLYGVSVWLAGELDPGAWWLIGALLLVAMVAYGALWLLGWVIAGFFGTHERTASEPQSTADDDRSIQSFQSPEPTFSTASDQPEKSSV
jgi:hypothetical protein